MASCQKRRKTRVDKRRFANVDWVILIAHVWSALCRDLTWSSETFSARGESGPGPGTDCYRHVTSDSLGLIRSPASWKDPVWGGFLQMGGEILSISRLFIHHPTGSVKEKERRASFSDLSPSRLGLNLPLILPRSLLPGFLLHTSPARTDCFGVVLDIVATLSSLS
ncbi:hypothetical protein RRG08_013307 [Elysia crispata]|uniref:Uncharacterized protein n=1 Tax=Elysia crispata TaxID=231223 RepID=A0AAE1AZ96_9GAST|nr:hypothetical protein RRG08_013307 [Elysia crispata]